MSVQSKIGLRLREDNIKDDGEEERGFFLFNIIDIKIRKKSNVNFIDIIGEDILFSVEDRINL